LLAVGVGQQFVDGQRRGALVGLKIRRDLLPAFPGTVDQFNQSVQFLDGAVPVFYIAGGNFVRLEGNFVTAFGPGEGVGTNTSSLSVSAIAAACDFSERVIGIHFFNPPGLMKLVEIIPAIQTSEAITQKAKTIIDSWGKITVLAKDTPGFIVNRVARPFYGEALRILDEGIADVATIDYAMKEVGGFRMGPFELMDYIGNDINYTVTETVFNAFYQDPRYKPSFTQKRLAEAGYLGRKSGKGYYDYAENAQNHAPNTDAHLAQAIFQRILVMLINEAADALFWQVASKDDIELAMTKGVNYPKGLLHWADDIGIDTCVKMLDNLYDTYHEDRYRCSPLLRRMARAQTWFFREGVWV
ncbi:MAG TPA: hypothetical protein ENK85_07045, partial [Saprospiraceae bacterium]|nr:hypothetical protein [Saprospiraceae bacterium]